MPEHCHCDKCDRYLWGEGETLCPGCKEDGDGEA